MNQPPEAAAESTEERELADALIQGSRLGLKFELQQKEQQDAPTSSLSDRAKKLDNLRMEDHELDLSLKKWIGRGAPIALILQVVIVNGVLLTHLANSGWRLETELAIAWMAGTVVEAIGIVLVVAKYLFPESGTNWNAERPPAED